MEKLVYVGWSAAGAGGPSGVREALLGGLGAELLASGARGLSFHVADAEAERLGATKISKEPEPPDVVLSVWLDTHLHRAPIEKRLREVLRRADGYLVLESVPLCRPPAPGIRGQRLPALVTVAFLRRPDTLSESDWLERWQGRHTQVAIETQSTFLYVQNVVVRALTPGAGVWHAVVEEAFPEAAAGDPMVFYDAGGSPQKLEKNQRRMLESCATFIDFASLQSYPMSRYLVARAAEPGES